MRHSISSSFSSVIDLSGRILGLQRTCGNSASVGCCLVRHALEPARLSLYAGAVTWRCETRHWSACSCPAIATTSEVGAQVSVLRSCIPSAVLAGLQPRARTFRRRLLCVYRWGRRCYTAALLAACASCAPRTGCPFRIPPGQTWAGLLAVARAYSDPWQRSIQGGIRNSSEACEESWLREYNGDCFSINVAVSCMKESAG